MKAKVFPEVTDIVAEHQDEHENLPVHFNPKDGSITMCFELSPKEWKRVAESGEIYFKMLIGNNKVPPIAFSCLKEELL